MKTRITKTLMLMLALGLWSLQARGQNVVLTASSVTVCPGTAEVVVPITAQNFNGVASVSLTLIYDTNALTYLGYQNVNTAFNSGILLINHPASPGNTMVAAYFGLTPISIGSATLFSFRFAYNGGSAAYSWSTVPGDNLISDINGAALPTTYVNGALMFPTPLTLISGPVGDTIDEGDTTQFSVTAVGATAYLWQLSTNTGQSWTNLSNNAIYDGANAAVLHINGAPLSYNGYLYRCIISESACGNADTTGPVLLKVNEICYPPLVYNVTGGGNLCLGGNGVAVGLSQSETGVVYTLLRDGLSSGQPVNGTGTAINFGLQTLAGTYTVSAMKPCSTVLMNGSAVVSVHPLPTLFDVTGGGSYCQGGNGVAVGLSGSESTSFYTLYLNGSVHSAPIMGTGSALNFGQFTQAGVYTVQAVNAFGCNATMDLSAVVMVNALPQQFSMGGGGSYCDGGSGVAITLSGSQSGVDYELQHNGSLVATLAGTGSALSFQGITAPGLYSIDAIDGNTGCMRSMGDTVMVNILALPVVSLGSLPSVCANDAPLTLNQGSPAGGVYAGTGVSGANTFQPAIAGAGMHLISYTFTDQNGCSASDTGLLEVKALPAGFTVTGGGSYCPTEQAPLIGLTGSESGASYALMLNQSTQVTSLAGTGSALSFGNQTAAGAYTVVATYSSQSPACSAPMTGTVQVNILPLEPPMASTVAVNGVGTTSANVEAEAMIACGSPITLRGIVYSVVPSPTLLDDQVVAPQAGSGSFTLAISGLAEGMTYYVRAFATNSEGTTYGNELSFTTLVTPAFTALGLEKSTDMTSWSPVAGTLGTGFTMTLNPTVQYYYLDVDAGATQTNVPLQSGSYAGFTLTSYPAGLFAYWDTKGVNATASTGTWQATMWQIINGNLPIFFIRTNADGSLSLIDGLMKALGQPDELLKLNGDYPLGIYGFSGTLTGENGVVSLPVNVSIMLNGTVPGFTVLELSQTKDKVVWEDVAGSLAAGYALLLDSTVSFYYLDIKMPPSQTNIPLGAPGYYGFYVNTYPAGFYTYWDGRGVNASALPGTWQATMWQIISGNLPILYVKASPNSDMTLVDGLQYALGQPDDFLRISGDYPEGYYTFTGTITGINGVVSNTLSIPVTVTRQCIPPVVMSGPASQTACEGDDVTFSMVVAGSTPFTYQWKYNGADLGGETGSTLVLSNITTTLAGSYSCAITNDCGNTVSAAASLTVNQAPVISTHPASASVYATTPVSFQVSAVHSTGYQWQVSQDGGTVWADLMNGAAYSGVTTATLSVLSPTLMMNGYQFRCVAEGLCTPDAVSNPATLIVTIPVSAIITTVPHLTAVPGDTVVVPIMVENFYGVSAVSLALGFDPAVVSFLEFRNTHASLQGSLFFANSTANEVRVQWLSLIPVNLGNTTLIEAAFIYSGGSTPLVWRLQPSEASQYGNNQAQPFPAIWNNGSINPASQLSISVHPVNASACNGAQASFSVSASGATSYLWQVSTNAGSSWTSLAANPAYTGATSATLQVMATHAGMNYSLYRCQVSDGLVTLNSGAAYLFVTPWANLSLPVSAAPGTEVCSGTAITFSVPGASLLSNPAYTWFLNGMAVGYGSTYVLTNPADGDEVNCTILSIDDCAAITSFAPVITLDPLPVITQQPAPAIVYEGDTVSFSVLSPNSGAYQWQVSTNGGQSWSNLTNGPAVSGSATAALSLNGVSLGMTNYRYRCLLTEATCGETLLSQAAQLTVKQLPIYTYAGTDSACPGDQVVIPVSAVNFVNVASASLRFSYDTAVLDFTGFQNVHPAFATGTLLIGQNQNQVSVAFFGLTPLNIGNGLLFEVTFTYKGGSTALAWSSNPAFAMYTSYQAQTLESYFYNGSVLSKPQPMAYNLTGGGSYCAGGNGVNVGLDGSEIGVEYELFRDSQPTSSTLLGTGGALSFGSQLNAGTYSIQATNLANGCLNMMNGSAVVVVNALPAVSLTLNPDGVCVNAVPFALSGGLPAGGIYSGNGVSMGSFDPASVGTGVYSITYTYTDGNGCVNSATDNLMVNPMPVLIISPATPVICQGETVNLSVPGGNTYLWSTGETSAMIQVSPMGTTSYSVTATNSFGCTQSGTVTVTVNPVPTVSIDPVSDTICEGSWVTLSASGAAQYAWSTGSTSPVITISPVGTTVFSVTGTNALGCSAVATSAIEVLPAPSLVISPAQPSVCAGQSVALLATGALSYAWSTGATVDNITVTPAATTTYSLTGTDVNGCTSEATITVQVNALPLAYTLSGGGAYCSGSTAPDVLLSGSQTGVAYTLLLDGISTGSILPGSGQALNFGPQAIAGSYSVLATDATSLCTRTMIGSVVVSIDPLPVFSLQPADLLVNIGAMAQFQALASPAIAYQWQVSMNNGSTWTNLTDGGAYSGVNTSSLSVGPVPSSFDGYWFRVKVTAATCEVYSLPASLSVNPVIPTLGLSMPSFTPCPGDTLIIPVTVNNFNYVGSLGLHISFDPSVVQPIGYQNVLNGLNGANFTAGMGTGSLTWTGTAVSAGSATLLELVMVYSGGNSGLNWNASSFVLNGFGDTIPTAYTAGTVTQASQAPVITGQPNPQNIFEAGSASFSVIATGASAFQWQVSTNLGASWTNLMNGAIYSGVTTNTLSLTGTPLSYNGNWYRCLAFEAVCGLSDISAPAALKVVQSGLTIQTTLGGATACPGDVISLPLGVSNLYNISSITLNIGYDTNVVSYTGYTGVHAQLASGTLLLNQTGTHLSIAWFSITPAWISTGDLMTLHFAYKGGSTALSFNTVTPGACLYTNALGNPVVSTYTGGNAGPSSVAPVITGQPQAVTVMATLGTGFSVSHSGSASYAWEMSTDGGATWSPLANGASFSGVNTSSLSLSNVLLSMNGYRFRCILTEPVCSLSTTSAPALLTVIPYNPNIITTIPDLVSCPDTLVVPILVQGVDDVYSISLKLDYDTNALEYLGFQNPHPALTGGFLTLFPQNGKIGLSWFSLSEAQIMNGTLVELRFVYHGGNAILAWDTTVSGNCIYSNLLGAPLDDEYHNGSITSFGPILTAQPMDVTADDGDTAIFSVNASLASAFQWQLSTNGGNSWTNLSNTGSYSGVTTATLLIDPVLLAMDGYLYRVKVSGSCPDEYSDPAELSVTPPLPLITTSIGTLNACAGNIQVPVRVSNMIGVKSFNLALWFNTDSVMMHYTGYSNTHPALSGGTLSVSQTGDSVIYMSFTSANGVTVGTDSLLVLNFISTGGNTNLRWNTNDPLACQYLDPAGYPFPELYLNGSLRVYELPFAATAPTGPSSICIGGAPSQYVTDTVKYADSYIWTLTPASAGTVLGNTHTVSVAWNAMFAGTATLSVKAVNSCGTGTASPALSITVNSLPGQAAMPTGPTTLCVNPANTTYQTTGATNASSYTWQLTPSAAGSLTPNGTQVTVNWSNTFTGYAVLTVRGSNSCGNGLNSNGLLITVNPGISVNLGPDQTVCASHSVQLNAGNAGSTYQWSTGATTQVITVDTTGLGTGTFTFSVTVTSNLGCQASDAVQVTFDPCVGLPETWVTELEVYPNPNQGRFDIRLTTPYPSHSQLWLTNALGEMVWNTGIEGPQSAQAYSVSLPALPAGVYFLRYSSGESTLTRKVVIQH